MFKTSQIQWVSTILLFIVLCIFLAIGFGTLQSESMYLRTDSLLNQIGYFTKPDFLLLIISGLGLCYLLPRLVPIQASLLIVSMTLPFVYLSYVTINPPLTLPMEFSLLTLLMLFSFNILVSWFTTYHKQQKVLSVFGHYIPPELVKQLERNPNNFNMEGQERELTVLFCDIKNFTSMSESLDPKELIKVLNTLFDPLTEVVHSNMGTIDKYMGDAMMAFWGAPVFDAKHAEHATQAAMEMQVKLKEMRRDFKKRGWPEIYMGIGINTGVMNVGNMGSLYRVSYTVVGDAVNLASRLEGATRKLFSNIIVSVTTRDESPDMLFRELGSVHVKGKKQSVRVFEPLGKSEDAPSDLREKTILHEKAIAAYYARQWQQAETMFCELQSQYPKDKIYDLYIEHIRLFSKIQLPENWGGELDVPKTQLSEVSDGEMRKHLENFS